MLTFSVVDVMVSASNEKVNHVTDIERVRKHVRMETWLTASFRMRQFTKFSWLVFAFEKKSLSF